MPETKTANAHFLTDAEASGTFALNLSDGIIVIVDGAGDPTGELRRTGPAGVLPSRLPDNVVAVISDPGDAGTITPTDRPREICAITTAGAAETRVLGVPDHIGQILVIHHAVDGGDFSVTIVAGHKNGGAADDVAAFAEVDDVEILVACGVAATDWRWFADKGVVFS